MNIRNEININIWINPAVKICKFATLAMSALFAAGCNSPSGEGVNQSGASWCETQKQNVELTAIASGSVTKNNWELIGPPLPQKNEGLPMGMYNNQLIRNLEVPAGSSSVHIKLPVSSSVPSAYLILDMFWFNDNSELKHNVTSIRVGDAKTGLISSLENVPPDSTHLKLSARPWREIDGIITINVGEVVWCHSERE